MHHIDQILNFHGKRKFQNKGTKYLHSPIHEVNAPKIEDGGSEVVEFIDKYMTFAVPGKAKYPETRDLVKKVQTYHYVSTCRKKKGVICRFNTLQVPSDETRIVHFKENIDETEVKQSKVTEEQYGKALVCME